MVVLRNVSANRLLRRNGTCRAGTWCENPFSHLLLAAMWCLCAGAGCAGPRPSSPSVDSSALSDEGFQAYLAEVDLVTVNEAYRAVLILADGEDTSKTFEERKQRLESRGIVRKEWDLQPENVVDAGSLAYMICQICKVRGGVCYNLFGRAGLGDRRYALRELIYREMVDDMADYQYVTGTTMVGLLAKADELMQRKGLYKTEEIDLSDEKDRDEFGRLQVPRPDELPEE
jgi:hypothetical protein